MSFWNNPENNTMKVLLVIVILGAVGFGIFKLAGKPDSNLQGSVFQGTKPKNNTEVSGTVTESGVANNLWWVICDKNNDGIGDSADWGSLDSPNADDDFINAITACVNASGNVISAGKGSKEAYNKAKADTL